MTALLFAARGGHLEMVRLLLDRGASISDSSRVRIVCISLVWFALVWFGFGFQSALALFIS